MALEDLETAQDQAQSEAHDDRRGHDTDVVDVRIDDIEVVQSRRGPEEHEGQDGAGQAAGEGGCDVGPPELLGDRRRHDLDDGDEGGQARQGKGGEEEEAEDRPARHLGDDGREGHKGEGGSRDALEFADRDVLHVRHEAEGREDADAGEQLEGGVGEGRRQPRAHEIGATLEVGGVGQHDPEPDGQ